VAVLQSLLPGYRPACVDGLAPPLIMNRITYGTKRKYMQNKIKNKQTWAASKQAAMQRYRASLSSVSLVSWPSQTQYKTVLSIDVYLNLDDC